MPSKDNMTFNQVLEDIEVRFINNLPESELANAERLFFQIEQAYWFYEDFYSDKYNQFPHFQLKKFAEELFRHSRILSPMQNRCDMLFDDFCAYRYQIPVFGCILLNKEMSKVVLVRNWKGSSWGFPKGKINQSENPLACAVREVIEETGFNAAPHCNEEDFLVVYDDKRLTKVGD